MIMLAFDEFLWIFWKATHDNPGLVLREASTHASLHFLTKPNCPEGPHPGKPSIFLAAPTLPGVLFYPKTPALETLLYGQ